MQVVYNMSDSEQDICIKEFYHDLYRAKNDHKTGNSDYVFDIIIFESRRKSKKEGHNKLRKARTIIFLKVISSECVYYYLKDDRFRTNSKYRKNVLQPDDLAQEVLTFLAYDQRTVLNLEEYIFANYHGRCPNYQL